MFFLKKWAKPGLFFLYFRLFNTQLTVNKCSIYISKPRLPLLNDYL